jgi:hypothetical protein
MDALRSRVPGAGTAKEDIDTGTALILPDLTRR